MIPSNTIFPPGNHADSPNEIFTPVTNWCPMYFLWHRIVSPFFIDCLPLLRRSRFRIPSFVFLQVEWTFIDVEQSLFNVAIASVSLSTTVATFFVCFVLFFSLTFTRIFIFFSIYPFRLMNHSLVHDSPHLFGLTFKRLLQIKKPMENLIKRRSSKRKKKNQKNFRVSWAHR